jgi:hypothetical protein
MPQLNGEPDRLTWREFALVILCLLVCLTSECNRVPPPVYYSPYER